MQELNTPPPHKPHRPERRRPTVEHDVTPEEDLPIDAPDVEGPQRTPDLRSSPAVRHPKTSGAP